MSTNLTSIDISHLPDLLRIAEEVKATKTPRELKRDRKTVAILMPPQTRPHPRSNEEKRKLIMKFPLQLLAVGVILTPIL
jgi:hypothetical protein